MGGPGPVGTPGGSGRVPPGVVLGRDPAVAGVHLTSPVGAPVGECALPATVPPCHRSSLLPPHLGHRVQGKTRRAAGVRDPTLAVARELMFNVN